MVSHLENQIKDWQKRGVITDEIALALHEDVRASLGKSARRQPAQFSFFRIVAVFAAICFAAAILMFISANWAAIPRLMKVGAIMALIGGGLIGGALIRDRLGRHGPRLEEAFYLVAGAAYVGGVALVGQMYHLAGTIGQAMLGFALGLGVAGVLVRSQVLRIAALGAIAWWYLEQPAPEDLLTADFAILTLFCVIGWVAGHLDRARWVKRAAIAAWLVGLVPLAIEIIEAIVDAYQALPAGARLAIWMILLATSIIFMALERYRAGSLRSLPGLGAPRAGFAFGLGLVALLALHAGLPDLLPLIVLGPLTLAFSLFALFAHGARNTAIRYAAYVVFAGEILFLYGETVASLLGTAGFFFVIGLTLTVIALVIWWFEQRVRRRKREAMSDG